MSAWLSLLPLLIQAVPDIQAAWKAATSNTSFGQELTGLAAPLGDLIGNIGAKLFPKAAPTLHTIGGAIAVFNPNYTKWLQGALNQLSPSMNLPNPNLVVDGIYGPKTVAAVEAVQTHLGIVVDGLAGKITQKLLADALAALPQVH